MASWKVVRRRIHELAEAAAPTGLTKRNILVELWYIYWSVREIYRQDPEAIHWVLTGKRRN